MKMHFLKINPRVIKYRKYTIFQSYTFINSLKKELKRQRKILDTRGIDTFLEICNKTLDKYEPIDTSFF